MKRFFCFFILLVILCGYVSPVKIAAEDVTDRIEKIDNATTYSCAYDKDSGSIKISGTMSHDVTIKYKDHSIVVYQLLPGKDVSDVIDGEEMQPIAKSAMSIKFQFLFDVKNIADKFSRYAVFLSSPEGTLVLADAPQYVDLPKAADAKADNSEYYKGILVDNINDLVPDTVIVPVYLDSVLSNIPKGYLYQNNFSQLYFDKNYIDDLDAKINAALTCGSKVYLQFILRVDGVEYGFPTVDTANAKYLMPDPYSEKTMVLLDAFTTFITERHCKENLKLSGIILGKNINLAENYNACGIDELESYIEAYSDYLAIVTITSKNVIPELDIFVPFYASNVYLPNIKEVIGFSSSQIIEGIAARLEDSLSKEFSFKTLMESDLSPLEIKLDENGDYDISLTNVHGVLAANHIEIYSSYLKKSSDKYENLSSDYIYVWTPHPDLKSSELELLYAYSYYKLLDQTNLISFVVSFEDNQNFYDVKNVIKGIDSDDAFDVSNDVLRNFGLASWNELIDGLSVENIIAHKKYRGEVIVSSIINVKGQYKYFDFFGAESTEGWSNGRFCDSVNIKYNFDVESDVLKADFSIKDTDLSSAGELYYAYDLPESFIYTPYLSFLFMLEDVQDPHAIYELTISLFGADGYLEVSDTVYANHVSEIAFNTGDFSKENKVNSIKVTARKISGGNGDFCLWLKDVTGYSTEYSTSEVERLIYEERNKNTINTDDDADESRIEVDYGIILGLSFAVIGIGIGLFMSLRKDSSYTSN